MSPQQERNLHAIKAHFAAEVEQKYRAGDAEYGGSLTDWTPLQLVEAAIEETVDQYTYLCTLRDKLRVQEQTAK